MSLPVDLALLVLRALLGGVMLAHGINHVLEDGRLDISGTAGWFEGLGMRPPRLNAWLASLTEIGAGALLVAGLFTPVAAAGVVGTLAVAWVTNHRDAGFFVFNRPTEGWEYLLTLITVALVVATLGPGDWSADAALDLAADLDGWVGLVLAAGLGGAGAAATLALFWRPDAND